MNMQVLYNCTYCKHCTLIITIKTFPVSSLWDWCFLGGFFIIIIMQCRGEAKALEFESYWIVRDIIAQKLRTSECQSLYPKWKKQDRWVELKDGPRRQGDKWMPQQQKAQLKEEQLEPGNNSCENWLILVSGPPHIFLNAGKRGQRSNTNSLLVAVWISRPTSEQEATLTWRLRIVTWTSLQQVQIDFPPLVTF